jgi:hypothetical protein
MGIKKRPKRVCKSLLPRLDLSEGTTTSTQQHEKAVKGFQTSFYSSRSTVVVVTVIEYTKTKGDQKKKPVFFLFSIIACR